MATPEEEQARRDALGARRKAGDDAWSPSRAREALRVRVFVSIQLYLEFPYVQKHVGKGGKVRAWPAQHLLPKADETGALDTSEAFAAFCEEHVGAVVDVRDP